MAPPEPAVKASAVEWGTFLHRGDEVYTDFARIRAEIEAETDRTVGSNKAISAAPIRLAVYSPSVLNLTLVDLPGLTKVPVGDQPTDVEHLVRSLIMSYIERPNAVILAVSPANADLANSDALQLAREVDPAGDRTVGVITKLDLMDSGTDAVDMLSGRVIPLKLGFVGVVNRSQADIVAGKAISAAAKSEKKFFETHEKYSRMASKMGVRYLLKRLNQVLLDHIRTCLPDLRARINRIALRTQEELASYGDESQIGNQGAVLLQLLTKFASAYRDSIDGKAPDMSTQELHGGARINWIFTDVFATQLDGVDACGGLTHDEVRMIVRNAGGPRTSLFIPEASFELLARKQITRLGDPAKACARAVHDELIGIITECADKTLVQYAVLKERVVNVASRLLRDCMEPTIKLVDDTIGLELAYINTNHPDLRVTEIMTTVAQHSAGVPASGQAGGESRINAGTSNGGTGGGDRAGIHGRRSTADGSDATGLAVASSSSNTPNGGSGGMLTYIFGNKNKNDKAHKRGHKKKGSDESKSATEEPAPPRSMLTGRAPSEKENVQVDLILNILSAYFNIIRRKVEDSVPKAVMYQLVNKTHANMQNALVGELYREEMLDELLTEAEDVAAQRKHCRSMLEILQRAIEILREIEDFRP